MAIVVSRRGFLAGTASVAVLHPFAARAQGGQAHLRIMETTDLHVHVFPYDYYADKPVDTVGLSRTAALIVAKHSTVVSSAGADTMFGSGGADILLGGDEADDMSGDAGNDVLIGDNGQVTLASGVVVRVETTEPTFGAADTISGGNNDDIALGGIGGDMIDGGADTDGAAAVEPGGQRAVVDGVGVLGEEGARRRLEGGPGRQVGL